MFLKILMIISIAGSAAVIVLAKTKIEPEIKSLQNNLAQTSSTLSKTQGDLTDTKDKLSETQQERDTLSIQKKGLEKSLEDEQRRVQEAKRQATAAEAAQKAAERKAKATEDMNREFFALRDDLKLDPKKIRAQHKELPFVKDELKTIKKEQTILMGKFTELDSEVNALRNPEAKVALPTGLTGKVLQVDPKWKFIIVDIGANHGVRANGEMTVQRDGRYIARVKVSKVTTDWSVANELEILGDEENAIEEGDVVITPGSMSYDPTNRKNRRK